jgi:hypothetical protein
MHTLHHPQMNIYWGCNIEHDITLENIEHDIGHILDMLLTTSLSWVYLIQWVGMNANRMPIEQ